MRLEFDEQGYVCCVLYGCESGSCTEYTGTVPTQPEEYESIDDWANRAKVQAYKLDASGNLTYDAGRAASLCPEDEVAPYNLEQLRALGIIDIIYPVGSLYMSVNDVSPEVLFGGEWEQIEDRFLLAAGSTYDAGTTGGATSQTIPDHRHLSPIGHNGMKAVALTTYGDDGYVTGQSFTGSKPAWTSVVDSTSYSNIIVPYTSSAGKATVSTMPPYMAVFVWKRTA